MKSHFAAAVLAGVVGLSACSGNVEDGAHGVVNSAPGPVARVDGSAASQAPIRHVVRLSGALQRHYALPTIAEFEASPAIFARVSGRVLTVSTEVLGDGAAGLVASTSSISVSGSTVPGLVGREIRVRELGGVVSVRAVRESFESKFGRPIAAKELDELVDFRIEGQPHTAVADQVVFWIASPGGEKNGGGMAPFDVAARMKLDPTIDSYRWYGESPNPSWDPLLTRAAVERLMP